MKDEAFALDLKRMYAMADAADSLSALLPSLGEVLARHPDALAGVTYSYLICATDIGYSYGFSIRDGHFALLSEGDEADVTVSGTEQNLLRVFKRQIKPLSAMLRGKVSVKGSLAALGKLGELL